MEQIIKVEKTGTLNLPKNVIEPLELKKDDRLVVFSCENGIVIKKISTVPLAEQFKKLTDDAEARFKKQGVTEKDISKAVEWARK